MVKVMMDIVSFNAVIVETGTRTPIWFIHLFINFIPVPI